jgi:heme-degrading monooxygenase HmoA
MHATFRYYAGNAELADRLAENRSEVEGVIRGIDGFRAYYLIRTTSGDTISLSVFDDESAAEESTRAAAAWIRENLPDLTVSPQVSAGEVVIAVGG